MRQPVLAQDIMGKWLRAEECRSRRGVLSCEGVSALDVGVGECTDVSASVHYTLVGLFSFNGERRSLSIGHSCL